MTETSSSSKRSFRGGAVIVALVAIVATAIVMLVFILPSINDRGVAEQSGLNAEYSAAAAALSECLTSSTQAAQVASANAAAFENVIKATVAKTNSPTANVDLRTDAGRNAFLPILAQAWPDATKQAELFDRVITVVVDCQGKFRGAQLKVQDHVRSFDTWRHGFWTSKLGAGSFPNDQLVVSIGANEQITGLEALKKMRTPIVSEAAGDAYKNGTFKPQDLFPQNTAAAPTTR